jgi:nicotinate-nucleotide pyrophosphorylase (carboxylating)
VNSFNPETDSLAQRLIALAIEEDLGSGDITTELLVPKHTTGTARIIAKEQLTVCGLLVAKAVFKQLDPEFSFSAKVSDGVVVSAGEEIASMSGSLQTILSGERTALNFLQRLSGIASQTSRLVGKVSHTKAILLDTRKTTPGLRVFEKYAVTVGGGSNHRHGLYDRVLIKNNHIDALGGDVSRAVALAKAQRPSGMLVEVEVRSIAELNQAVSAEPDIILFDNMSPDALREALLVLESANQSGSIISEASGGIGEGNLVAYAETGVQFISLGALTHSARSMDLSLRFVG